ncbi:hypothetical protein J6590_049516 [Homalodisca vitripennis]|nr:hypothetical protein J6590_049516 [Homalodisca vitripennis]
MVGGISRSFRWIQPRFSGDSLRCSQRENFCYGVLLPRLIICGLVMPKYERLCIAPTVPYSILECFSFMVEGNVD